MKRPVVIAALSAVTIIIAVVAAVRMSASSRPAASTVSPESAAAARMTPSEADDAIKKAEESIAKSPDSPRSENAYLSLARAYEAKEDLRKSKEAYQKFIEKFPSSNNIPRAQEAIESLNIRILFSREAGQGSTLYEVQKGDNLTRIAKKFNTTVELISKSNGLKDSTVRVGRKLKVPEIKFSIVVDKSQNILTLKADGNVFKTYSVSTGKESTPTPAGTFKITNRIVDPPWYPPNGKAIPAGDSRNVLGSRWLGISKPSYGLHGTIDPASIGKSVTEGCVRLKNEDVEELYLIVPEGTEVVIVD